mgnify:CR=1 FL=1
MTGDPDTRHRPGGDPQGFRLVRNLRRFGSRNGGLALLETGDRIRIDLNRGEANLLVDDEELAARRARLEANGGYPYRDHQTPWQEIQRSMVEQLDRGALPAAKEGPAAAIATSRGLAATA